MGCAKKEEKDRDKSILEGEKCIMKKWRNLG
jgi:hypothetical protein